MLGTCFRYLAQSRTSVKSSTLDNSTPGTLVMLCTHKYTAKQVPWNKLKVVRWAQYALLKSERSFPKWEDASRSNLCTFPTCGEIIFNFRKSILLTSEFQKLIKPTSAEHRRNFDGGINLPKTNVDRPTVVALNF